MIAGQYGRMLRRRCESSPRRSCRGIGFRRGGRGDTVGVAVEGYQAAGRTETVLFNMLSGFLGAFAFIRLGTWGIRDSWWPWGNVRLGDRHIHHFVPGILTAFGAGTVAVLTENEKLEEHLAVPLGAGMGLTFDEAALLLDLRDVYWSREGLLSLQLTFGTTATLSAAIILIRMLRRGEQRQEAAGAIPHARARRTTRRRFRFRGGGADQAKRFRGTAWRNLRARFVARSSRTAKGSD